MIILSLDYYLKRIKCKCTQVVCESWLSLCLHVARQSFCLDIIKHVMCSVHVSAGVCWKCLLHAAGAAEGLTPLAAADVKHHAVKNVRLTQRGTLANPD